jgi:hypothetical protein
MAVHSPKDLLNRHPQIGEFDAGWANITQGQRQCSVVRAARER